MEVVVAGGGKRVTYHEPVAFEDKEPVIQERTVPCGEGEDL